MMKPVLWCEPLICAQRYRVFFVDANDPRLCGKEAVTIWEDCLVLLSNDVADDRAPDALTHEIGGHAVLDAFGIGPILREKHRISESRWRALEEDLARTLAVHTAATYMANGWMTLPPIPKRPKNTKPVQLVAAKARRSKR